MRRIRIWVVPIIIIFVGLLILLSGIYDARHVFVNIDENDISFSKGKACYISNGDVYGIIPSEGPGFNLEPGEYRLKWRVYADGENKFHLSFENGAKIEPEELTMSSGEEAGEFSFWVLEPGKGLQVKTEFREGTHLEILFLRLYTPILKDRSLALFIVFVLLALGWILISIWKDDREWVGPFLAMILTLFLISIPLFRDTLNEDPIGNGTYQIEKLEAAFTSLKNRHFLSLRDDYAPNGWGNLMPVYSPNILLMVFAVLRMMHLSTVATMRFLIFCIHLGTEMSWYYSTLEITQKREYSAGVAIIMLMCPVRFYLVYYEFLLQQAAVVATIPLVFAGIHMIVSRKRWGVPTLALSEAAIYLESPLWGCIIFIMIFLASFLFKNEQRKNIWISLGTSIGLCAYNLIPFCSLFSWKRACFGMSGIGVVIVGISIIACIFSWRKAYQIRGYRLFMAVIISVMIMTSLQMMRRTLYTDGLRYGLSGDPEAILSEYLPDGATEIPTRRRNIISGDDVQILEQNKEGNSYKVKVRSEVESFLEFPFFLLPGTECFIEGKKVKAQLGTNSAVKVILPPNTEGIVEIQNNEPIVWRIGQWISICMFILLFAFFGVYVQKGQSST